MRATSYGIIELVGWNKYGGWRIGIRDLHGNYHYFGPFEWLCTGHSS
nr:hypothetical protein [Sporolactobacillus inulinus]